MSKWIKRILGLAAVGSAAAGLAYYLKKSSSDETDEDMDDFEDEDFDLDHDLKPVTDREYVPLNTAPKESPAKDSDSSDGKQEDQHTDSTNE